MPTQKEHEELSKNLLISGWPGIGKTFLIKQVTEILLQFDFRLEGFYTEEILRYGQRVGFKAIGFNHQQEVIAHRDYPGELRVSAYGINTDFVDEIVAASLERGLEIADLLIIDEIGPMELTSVRSRDAIHAALDSQLPVLGTIAIRSSDPFMLVVKERPDTKILVLDENNRKELYDETIFWATQILKLKKDQRNAT